MARKRVGATISATEMLIGGGIILVVGYLLMKKSSTTTPAPTTVITTTSPTGVTSANPAVAQAQAQTAQTTVIANDATSAINNLMNTIFS